MEGIAMYNNQNGDMRELDRGASSVIGFMVGAAIGAGIALLLAPDSGRETRRRLGQTARRWSTSMKDGVETARGRVDDLKSDVRTAVASGREAFNRERDARAGTTGNPTTQPIP
jgi:gas vesicle protein